MKKDIFNAKISTECVNYVKFSLIFFSLITLICAVISFCVALLYQNVEPIARIVIYCLAGVSLLMAIINLL